MPLAGAVALAVLLGVAAYVIFTRQRACTGEKLTLRVVATPDLHPAINKIATKYNQDPHPLDDRCVTVAVTKESTSKAGNGLINGKLAADLWVADSSLTVDRLRGSSGGEAVPEPAGSIARSPIVLAAAKSAATTLTKTFQPSWQGLINTANVANPNGPGRKIRVLALDPQKNAAGLSALLAAAGAARKTGLTDKQLVGALKQLSGQVVADPAALLASLTVKSGRKVPLGVATEQSVWAHNTKKPDAPVVPLYPVEGTLSLDYPIMVTAKDPTAVKAAAAFQKQLGAESARKTMRDYGFRSPDGKSGSALSTDRGFSAAAPAALEPPDGKAVASMAQSWSRLNLGTRLLALLDVSGTMVLPVPGTTMNRMQAIGKIAGEGLGLFPASSEIGVWAFSTLLQGEQDWRELVSVGPLAESVDGVLRKEALAQQLATVQAKPTGDTGLNDTLMAAYQQMKASYERDKINTILILTDGAGNDDPGGTTDAQILNYLKKEYDPKRPVNLLIIAFGPDAPKGKKQMDALAKASGGEAYIAKDVLAVRDFFLRGMSRRLCMPDCEDDS
ncbi:substrate-binding and VWA domain-containing protein [Nonomuraea sp. NPDC046570]|uniref:substrate-binding and VWA domain-containing protein n=1 Tax=Nonomuraea sp. NPDC046570 TaxID=3155255 RepID=UPI00340A36C0